VALSADGRTAFSGADDCTIRVWNLDSGQCRNILDGHTRRVSCVALSADGRTAFSGADDGMMREWDLDNEQCRDSFNRHTRQILVHWAVLFPIRIAAAVNKVPLGLVFSVALSADAHIAISGANDGTILVWDLPRRRCCAALDGHTGSVRSMALSADGRTAVSGADDATVRVWNLTGGQPRATREGHFLRVNRVAMSADGHTAVSESEDRTVQVWDLVSRKCRATHPSDSPEARRAWEAVRDAGRFTARLAPDFLEIGMVGADEVAFRFPGNFSGAACSPDGRYVVAGDGSGQVYLLRLRCRND
jgi:predicted NACHT family NTPase